LVRPTVADQQVVDANPIINSPFEEPSRYWDFRSDGPPAIKDGRRVSGYLPPDPSNGGQPALIGDLVELPLVNDLRDRVRAWRKDGYRGATSITRDLFDRWFDDEREAGARPFFAQQEAMETVAFLTEAPPSLTTGVQVPRTEAYDRWCVKMATGSGKTLVMAMTIAWSVLNKAANPRDVRFADAVLVVCPNLTVKERLAGLDPHRTQNEYRAFDLVPPNLAPLLGQGRVLVTNWHALAPATDPKRSVLKRGPESDAAFCRRVIEPTLGKKENLLVLNDEAHHAYRHKAKQPQTRGEEAEEAERATVWVDGLARIHRDRQVLRCLDVSATPIYGSGSGYTPGTPFQWIVSDFALVDAIEAGLVKIPRIPTDDNAGAAVPKYRNLWEHVKKSLPRGAKDDPERGSDLTAYLTQVDGPLKQLAGEWVESFERWQSAGRAVPPAMIVICASTDMAQVLERHIGVKGAVADELRNGASIERTVRIDSKLLADAERREESETASDAAERLRRVVATVGKPGEPGADVRCLISVAMLSEGWDARNVTQILGLRAFSSQLLCEQVVGRGLRRSSYEDLSQPEYVDVYGVPFQLLPFARSGSTKPVVPPETTSVVARRDRRDLEIRFPRVVSVVSDLGMSLKLDREKVVAIRLDPENDPTRTKLTGMSGGGDEQDRSYMYGNYRHQRLLFELAGRVIKGQPNAHALFPEALRVVDWVVKHKVYPVKGVDRREVDNEFYKQLIVTHIQNAWDPGPDGSGRLLPVLDEYQPIGSTAGVAFRTTKPCEPTVKSHVNQVVCDSELEREIARELESDDRVLSYVKNDHLYCEVPYRFGGRTQRYIPDFLIDLGNRRYFVLEGKGRETARDAAKESAARRWCAAVNGAEEHGRWAWRMVKSTAEVRHALDDVLLELAVDAPAGLPQS
jgi:type III restriction enzyme